MRSTRLSSATLAVAGVSLWSSAHGATPELQTPSQPAISFFWGTFDDSKVELPRCGGMQIITSINPAAPRQVVPPLYFTAFPQGFEPETMQLPSNLIRQQFTWNADYPVGTNITFAMSDSANNSGGAVDRCKFHLVEQSSYNNCSSLAAQTAPISFTVDPPERACREIDIEITGGRAPYTLSVLAGTSGLYGNVTGIESKKFKLDNVVAAGQVFSLAVTDSTGASSAVSSRMVSGLNVQDCNAPTGGHSGSAIPVGGIVGAVVGGVLLALLLALVGWWFIRRRSRRREEEYRQAQIASSEFRNADGRAPLVEPFMLQTQRPNLKSTEQYSDISPTNDGSYDKSLDTYPSSPTGAYASEQLQSQYFSHPDSHKPSTSAYESPSPSRQPHYAYANPYDPYEASMLSSGATAVPGPYDTGSHDPSSTIHFDRQPSNSSATDDLAHPAEFEYRLPDSRPAWNSSASHLPPGARPYR
ncbi:uncharacterized protein JCM15063_001547 [Sporobolomyces koalae]|uniref:uncharacterized protein n=1 Tax=Sporobolomyces koalae TaxID=500713 RepID=UPI00317BD8B3